MTRRHLRLGLPVIALLVALSGCTFSPPEPTSTPPSAPAQPPAAVALTVNDSLKGQPIRVGILVGPTEGEGSAYRQLAEGARVAGYRFGMGGTEVSFEIALDDGTSEGAAAGLRELAGSGVIGIIAATSGPHLREALADAQPEPAVLVPYDTWDEAPAGTWRTAPTTDAIGTALSQALADTGTSQPLLITDSRVAAPQVGQTDPIDTDDDAAKKVVTALDSGEADSVVIAAEAATQAKLVKAIQAKLGTRQAPILLTPQALTPVFAGSVGDLGALAGSLVAVGPAGVDAAALQPGEPGAAASAFFTALRLAADDAGCLNIHGDAPFAQSAQWADLSSHDAVIALVRAAESAGALNPEGVRQALPGVQLAAQSGLAGPSLDFQQPDALPSSAVLVLRATQIDLGLRPPNTAETRLTWVPAGQ
ncbi:MAG: hypothetical protein QM804_12620 [Propionicimonas sp.]